MAASLQPKSGVSSGAGNLWRKWPGTKPLIQSAGQVSVLPNALETWSIGGKSRELLCSHSHSRCASVSFASPQRAQRACLRARLGCRINIERSTVDAKLSCRSQSQPTITTVSRQPKIIPESGLEAEEERTGVGKERGIGGFPRARLFG